MRSLLALICSGSLGLAVAACGRAGGGTDSAPRASPSAASSAGASASVASRTATEAGSEPKLDGDGDYDSAGKGRHDADDEAIVHFGHPASAGDARALTALVKRYYAAAANDEGGRACSMLYLQLYESVPEDYGESAGPPSLRGKTCAVVLSKLFKQSRRGLRDFHTLRVDGVRVDGNRGLIFLSFRGRPERSIFAHFELSVWKIDSMLDKGFR